MASYPKIADNEMNYFQFKAKQMLLLKKEDQEWQDFCKQIAPECAACVVENAKESKDVGIQALAGRSINKGSKCSGSSLYPEKKSLQPRYRDEHIPEALNNIKTQLEKIDLAISKLYDESPERKSRKEPFIQERSYIPPTPVFQYEQTLKPSDEQRRLLMQNSLKASLKKLHNSELFSKKPPVIKPKNSSFFLPHDLQVKRAAARRTYLASLQTKPKVSFQNVRKSSNKNAQTNQANTIVSKNASKSRKKVVAKKSAKEPHIDKEHEVLMQTLVTEDTKDENIESVVDGILDDLLGEAAVDLSRIKQRKGEKIPNILSIKADVKNAKDLSLHSSSLPSSPVKNSNPKVASDDNKSIMALKLFMNSSEKVQQESDNYRKEQLIDKSTITSPIEDSRTLHDVTLTKKSSFNTAHLKKNYEINKPSAKFVCGVSHVIAIDPEKAKVISRNRDRFWSYLENTSQTAKGNHNPWILNEMLAESFLNDCIDDIAEELSGLPFSFVQDMYNQEFVQQVEK